MAELGDINGKTFLVTGGASGFGELYVEEFLKGGAKFVAVLDIAEEAGKALAERLNKQYPNAVIFIKCDVGVESSITEAFNEVVEKVKRIDVFVNNAGIMSDAPNLWRKSCDVNWQGVVSLTMKGVDHMRKDKGGAGGTIINISSTAALCIWPFLPIYSGSKIAVLHFNLCLGMDPFFEQTGIRLLTICYGPTDTPLMLGLDQRAYDAQLGKNFAEESLKHTPQRVEWALAAFLDIFKNGAHNSVWSVSINTPAKDITQVIHNAFKQITNAVFN